MCREFKLGVSNNTLSIQVLQIPSPGTEPKIPEQRYTKPNPNATLGHILRCLSNNTLSIPVLLKNSIPGDQPKVLIENFGY